MRKSPGQAVLIVLLSMVVVLTIVLSVIASSTSDIKIGNTETSSIRAFSAAESGVEKSLATNLGSAGSVNSGASFNAAVTGLGQDQKSFIYPGNLVSGDSATFWFCGTSTPCFTGTTLNLCWGKTGTDPNSATAPAVEISVFYEETPGNISTTKVYKALFDPNSGRRSLNSYSTPDAGTCTIANTAFPFQKNIDLTSLTGLQFMAVRFVYNSDVPHPTGIDVNFTGNSVLPSQGSLVSSTGNLGTTTRRIEVTRSYNQIPSIFDSAVFSPNNITQ